MDSGLELELDLDLNCWKSSFVYLVGLIYIALYTKNLIHTCHQPPRGSNSVLTNGVAKSGLAGSTGKQKFYTFEAPSGATSLSFNLSSGSDDADLHVRYGSQPTTSSYDCRPWLTGNYENCTINNIPDNNPSGASSAISVNLAGQAGNMAISYNIIHTYRGDLRVQLIAPDGSITTLRNPSGGSTNNLNETINSNQGSRNAAGTWQLKVVDIYNQDTGYINSWQIEFL